MRKVIFLLVFIFTAAAGFAVYQLSPTVLGGLFDQLKDVEHITENLVTKTVEKEVLAPPPLKREKDAPQSYLTRSGVIEWTNNHRAEGGLPALSENELLNSSAEKKLNDMLQKQYFEHESPTGESAGDLADEAGYAYIAVGENLALGNFPDDKDLVQGWMDSPGHRENIMRPKYREIGVAVRKGMYKGKMTWMAVQHFGTPISSCPAVDNNLKAEIENLEARLDQKEQEVNAKKQEIENTPEPKTQEEADAYNKKVDEHNRLVNEYNEILSELKQKANTYNEQVNSFNSCASN